MKFLLLILCLFVFSCSDDSSSSSNFFLLDTFNSSDGVPILKFSENLYIDQFTIESFDDWSCNPCDEEHNPNSSGLCCIDLDTEGIYLISSEDIFGVNCNLFYDDHHRIITGYYITTEYYPDGTGESCVPVIIDNIMSVNGATLSSEINLNSSNSDMNVVPNPFISSPIFSETEWAQKIRFIHLPTVCTIHVYNGSSELITTILHNDNQFDSNEWWDLNDYNSNPVGSGIYLYDILNEQNEIIHQGSFIVIKPIEE